MNTDHCIDVCNRLLRGEQSAVLAYSKAIVAFERKESVGDLRPILDEHRQAVLTLAENVRSMGGEPSPDSGAWGSFANSVQGAANFLGDQAAIKSLQAGEGSGKSDYEAALKDEKVMPECKTLIQSNLLPAAERHIEILNRISIS